MKSASILYDPGSARKITVTWKLSKPKVCPFVERPFVSHDKPRAYYRTFIQHCNGPQFNILRPVYLPKSCIRSTFKIKRFFIHGYKSFVYWRMNFVLPCIPVNGCEQPAVSSNNRKCHCRGMETISRSESGQKEKGMNLESVLFTC